MSSRRDPRVFLWDAREAAATVLRFVHGKTFADFVADDLLRSAVERQLQIVGEALSQLARLDPALAERVPKLRAIVAFRNILVHGYALIDHENVWRILQKDVPALKATLTVLLDAENQSPERGR